MHKYANQELDPNGKSAHDKGSKLDQGKNRIGLVLGSFASALWAISEVGTFGANKYTDNGWQEVPNAKQRYEDALLRHWIKIKEGERIDKDSGLLHAAHLGWNALAYLYFELKDDKNEKTR